MQIRIVSDLHAEFSNYGFDLKPLPDDHNTTLILAGDISAGVQATALLEEWCDRFKHIIYICGNHEFYHNEISKVVSTLKRLTSDLPNVYFLEKESVELDGVSFFGATFWTPGGSVSQNNNAVWCMNDFRIISKYQPEATVAQVLTPNDCKEEFEETIDEYDKWMNNGFEGERVVVSHHAPSEESSLPEYKGNSLSPFFIFDAEKYCKGLGKVGVWIHGHCHNSSDYVMNSGTRVLCNPYGYWGVEVNGEFQEDLIITLEGEEEDE